MPDFTPEELASERWVAIPEAPDTYEVSDLGRVRRSPTAPPRQRARAGQILRPGRNSSGHAYVALRTPVGPLTAIVSRLVARAFLPPPSDPEMVVLRRNQDRADNRAHNLYWAPPPRQKLTRKQVREIREMEGFISRSEAAGLYGVTSGTIDAIWSGRTRAEE